MQFNSLSFAPYRQGQSPLTGIFPTPKQVDDDLTLIAPRTRAIRSYAALEGAYDLPQLAQNHGLKLWQGIWLGADPAQNAREITAGIAAANRFPDTITRVIVGNEVLLRRDLSPETLIAALDQVRAAIHQPVTYADVWEFWLKYPQVAAHVDFLTIHLLPYWEDDPTGIDAAVAHVAAVYHTMQQKFPGRHIAIGETGWPSRGRWRRDAAPGLGREALFLQGFLALAAREGLDYNIIEAFDQDWKYQNEGVVGANWGVFTADRREKFPPGGRIVEDPDWLWHAGLHLVLSLVLLGLGGRRTLFLSGAAFLLGGGLASAAAEAWPRLYDAHVLVAAVVNLGGQGVLAASLMRRLAGPVPVGRVYRTGAQASETVRRMLLLRWPPVGVWFEDLSFVFLWTAAVEQLLLVLDPRYRDFPIFSFAVPVLAVGLRAVADDLPRNGGGREELVAGLVLCAGGIFSAVSEDFLNAQSLAWTGCAVLLSAPPLLRLPTLKSFLVLFSKKNVLP